MVLVAAVAAVLLVGAIGHAPRHATAAAGAKTTMVKVDAKALRGRPVATVRRLLRHLGLTVDVRWRPSSLLPPGRVLAVRPAGMVRPGSHVILVGTLAPAAATVSPSASAAGTPGRPHHKPHPQPTAQPSPASSPSPAPSPSPSISTSPSPTATGSTAPARTPAPESDARPAPVR
jgi:beta-lactam-binding protein with PASTA domain